MLTPGILIIEDHKEYREAVRHFLELHNIQAQIKEASSGEEGVLLARSEKPQIVIMDFMLGGIDGLETAKQIKKHLPKCNIIMLTIYDPKEIFQRNGHGAINSFISKGDLYNQLVPAIRKILLNSSKNNKTTINKGG